ncbi:MAG: PAS domain S-box protein [Methylobacter sp.]|nr:PAS domain S-box protein [Methylobacter sp.]
MKVETDDNPVTPLEQGTAQAILEAQTIIDTATYISIKENAQHFQAIVDNVFDGFVTIDEHGIILFFNRAPEHIFGYAAHEVIGQYLHMLMPEPYHSEHDGYLKHYINTGEAKVIGIGREIEGKRKDGAIFPMELAVSEMWIDGNRMFIGSVRDITERTALERVKNEFFPSSAMNYARR